MRFGLDHRIYLLAALFSVMLGLTLGCKQEIPASIKHAGKFSVAGFPTSTEDPATFTINKSSKTGAFSKTIERPGDKKQIRKYEFKYEFIGTDTSGSDCYSLDWMITDENLESRSGNVRIDFDGRTSETLELDGQISICISAPDT